MEVGCNRFLLPRDHTSQLEAKIPQATHLESWLCSSMLEIELPVCLIPWENLSLDMYRK